MLLAFGSDGRSRRSRASVFSFLLFSPSWLHGLISRSMGVASLGGGGLLEGGRERTDFEGKKKDGSFSGRQYT